MAIAFRYGWPKLAQNAAGSSPWNCSSVGRIVASTSSTRAASGLRSSTTLLTNGGIAVFSSAAACNVTARGLCCTKNQADGIDAQLYRFGDVGCPCETAELDPGTVPRGNAHPGNQGSVTAGKSKPAG